VLLLELLLLLLKLLMLQLRLLSRRLRLLPQVVNDDLLPRQVVLHSGHPPNHLRDEQALRSRQLLL